MSARHIPCGVPVNESERQAIERLRTKLPDGWILLSNLTHSTSVAYPSDEIDLVIIGPPGVTVVEPGAARCALHRSETSRGLCQCRHRLVGTHIC